MSDDPDKTEKTDSWAVLKESDLWPKIKRYAETRLQGSGKRIRELEDQGRALEAQLAAYSQQTADDFDLAVEYEQLQGGVSNYVDMLVGQLPEQARQLVPLDLPPQKLLIWLGANLKTLVGGEKPAVRVHGGGPRGGADMRDAATIRRDEAIAGVKRRLLGGGRRR